MRRISHGFKRDGSQRRPSFTGGVWPLLDLPSAFDGLVIKRRAATSPVLQHLLMLSSCSLTIYEADMRPAADLAVEWIVRSRADCLGLQKAR